MPSFERSNLLAEFRKEKNPAIRERMAAVLLRDAGETFADIGKFYMIHEITARRHVEDWLKSRKLDDDSGGSAGKLDDGQAAAVVTAVTTASKNKPFTKAAEIAALVEAQFGIKFSVAGMTAWLNRFGFSWKKCEGTPAKADALAQAAWIETFGQFLATLPSRDVVLFADATHPTQATKLTHAWSPVGHPAVVSTTAGKKRVNVLGALEPTSLKTVITFPERVNSASMAVMLTAIRKAYPRAEHGTVHVFADQGSYNRSAATFAAAARLGIEIHLLPTYSPNLNVIERLWRLMNEQVRNNRYFATAEEFAVAIKEFFKRVAFRLRREHAATFALNFQRL